MKINYINTAHDFNQFCSHMATQPCIAIDTEFTREHTYYPKLCLLQVATDSQIALIDPLAINNLDALQPILSNPSIIKIFHAGSQDLEILFNLFATVTVPVFDTQIAATLLGLGNQIGYAKLIHDLLGHTLNKTQTRTDWSKRPLSDAQLEYAANDVRFLYQAYPLIKNSLMEKGRFEWLQSDLKQLSEVDNFILDLNELWRKVKGHQKFSGIGLAILQQLAIWRENVAQQVNKPRKHVIRDDILIEIARLKPRNTNSIKIIHHLPSSLSSERVNAIIAAVNLAFDTSPDHWPSLPKYKRLSKQDELLVDSLMIIMKWAANRSQLSSDIIGTKKDIQKLVCGDTDTALMQGWRYEHIGNFIQQYLKGDAQLVVSNGQVELIV